VVKGKETLLIFSGLYYKTVYVRFTPIYLGQSDFRSRHATPPAEGVQSNKKRDRPRVTEIPFQAGPGSVFILIRTLSTSHEPGQIKMVYWSP
jgi:hypothetical protein